MKQTKGSHRLENQKVFEMDFLLDFISCEIAKWRFFVSCDC